jgi:hypothetical protein
MSFEIKLEQLPAGYVAEIIKKGGSQAKIIATEFVSSEDGDLLVTRLEGIPADLVRKLPSWPGMREGSVEHLLAIIRRDKSATVYVNELNIRALMRIKRPFAKGERIFSNEIADIERVQLKFHQEEITVPPDAGVVFLFSVGWRKGLFYDFSPLLPPTAGAHVREFDLSLLFGQYYAYLMFQELFKITEPEWASLMVQQWFPFIGLNPGTIRTMLSHAREGDQIDELLEDIRQEVCSRLPQWKSKWEASPYLKDHHEILHAAADRYLANDHVSATALLFTRIEGILRSYRAHQKQCTSATQENLTKAVAHVGNARGRPYSLLMPDKFQRYLEEVYFASFNPESPGSTAVMNRNTLSHGVVAAEAFSLKTSTIGLLIVDQLSYYPPENPIAVETPGG